MPGQSIFAEGLEGLLAEGNVSRLPLQPRKRQKSAIVRIGRGMVIGQATEWLFVRKWTVPFMVWTSPGWEFALSLIRSSIFCSKSLILKRDRKQFAHIALYKRATVNDLLTSLFTKERFWAKEQRANEQIPNPGLVQTMKGIVHLFTKSHH